MSIPASLHGRWVVDADVLEASRRRDLSGGVVEIGDTWFTTHGFPRTVFDRRWDWVEVENDTLYADSGFEDVFLRLRSHDGDRMRVDLGGCDALGWIVEDLPLRRDGGTFAPR